MTNQQAHTPGPWHVQGLQVDPHGIIRIGGFEVVTEAYDVVGGNPGVAPIRKEADARLIAAAPDLLETCEAIATWHDNPSTPDDLTRLYGQAKLAIAKAKAGMH